jgi:hypothetical protein
MSSTITLAKEFDINNVSFSDVRMLDNGGKVVYVSYKNAPLILQTPQMVAPFGMSQWENEGKSNTKYTIDLSFKAMDKNPSMQAFYRSLETIDAKLVKDGFKNQHTWFKGKKYNSEEIVEALYTPLIRHAKDRQTGEITDKYPPTFKLTVPYKDGKFTCEAFDDSRNPVDIATVETKGSKVTAIIQCMGLWFAGGKFGSTWRIVQMKVVPNAMIRGYAFKEVADDKLPDEDLEENVHADPKEVMDLAVGKPPTSDDDRGGNVSTSDEEDEDMSMPRRKKLVGKSRD